MGYWEQLGEENARRRVQRGKMSPQRRFLGDVITKVLVITASLALWILMFIPALSPVMQLLYR